MFKKIKVKIAGIILGVFLLIFIFFAVGNAICVKNLRTYIDSFEVIEYPKDRIVPVKENGFYTITTDRDLEIMHITDIHIGGGIWSYKNDKKTVYELITALRAEKPDIVILGGDNTYCLPGIGFNGGFTTQNLKVHRNVIEIFEHLGVYFTTVFGNHDTESINVADRSEVGALYESDEFKYCLFESQFTDLDAETVPSVTNQFIIVKNTDGTVRKLLLLIDSNAYVDTSLITMALGKYDVIHDTEVYWAADLIKTLSGEYGLNDKEYLKTLAFMHIPIGEYQTARTDFESGNPEYTIGLDGMWDEKICYGGRNNEGAPEDQDLFFEVLCEEMDSVEAIFCGHDHVNNAVVEYKGVMLDYGFSFDNEAYGNKIRYSGLQRGATVITLKADGGFLQVHKNVYTDYGADADKFFDVYLDKPLYPDQITKCK